MTIFFICSIIQCVCVFILFCIAEKQRSRIKELAEEAETYKLVAEETDRMYRDLKEKVSESCDKERLIQVEYYTSESDLLKYKTEKAMENAISSRLAILIGHDIQKWFAPRVTELEGGEKKYSFVFIVRSL